MAFFQEVVAVLNGVWSMSTLLVKYVLLGFLGWGVYRYRAEYWRVLRFAFNDAVMHSAAYLVFSFVLAGIIHTYTDLFWAAVAVPVVSISVFFYQEHGFEVGSERMDWWSRLVHVATLAALGAAFILNTAVWNDVAAVLYYGILFWRI